MMNRTAITTRTHFPRGRHGRDRQTLGQTVGWLPWDAGPLVGCRGKNYYKSVLRLVS
jgi:hypothetical protein